LKYPTTSANLGKLIENRVSVLVKKKLLRRAENQPGVLPATNARNGAQATGPKQAVVKKPATPTAPGGAKNRLILPAALTQVLAKSAHPLSGQELAGKVRDMGYQTTSKDFTKNVWVAVGSMPTVEHVKGKGYRLKKGKGVK
jgi:hypothetical protein